MPGGVNYSESEYNISNIFNADQIIAMCSIFQLFHIKLKIITQIQSYCHFLS
jgi:hypothetical protein